MKKNGFTLIELLAVIVILAIIALIATPIILGIINDAREESNERSVELYASAVRNGIAAHQLREGKEVLPDTYNESNPLPFEVEYDGKVECTNVIISKDGKVSLEGCTVNGGTKEYSYGIEEESDDSKLCEYVSGQEKSEKTIGSKYECNLGAEKRNFYILELGSNPVADSNLSSDEVALILEGNYDPELFSWCASGYDNSCNADGLTGKLDEIASYWSTLNREQIQLPSVYQIASASNMINKNGTLQECCVVSWLYEWPDGYYYKEGGERDNYSFEYWTGDAFDDEYENDLAWHVDYSQLKPDQISGGLGVRPIIIISMSDLG